MLTWTQKTYTQKPGRRFKMGKITYNEIILAMLLSYPRSGNTWLRYCIENLTSISTRGYDTNPMDGSIKNLYSKKVVLKRHKVTGPEINRPLIFVLRNYKEVVRGADERTFETFKELCNGKNQPYDYIQSIKAFDESPSNEKLLIHYEDLMKDPASELLKICDFLGEGSENIESFVKNLTEHKKQSISFYENHGQKSHTKGDLNKSLSMDLYSKEDKVMIDKYMIDTLGKTTYDVYLKKYKEQ